MVGTRLQHCITPADDCDNSNATIPGLGDTAQLDEAEQDTFYIPNPTPTSIESQEFTTSPFTPTPITSSRTLTLKRKRSAAKTGRWQKDEQMWKYSRYRLPHEEERNDYGQRLFYCEFCTWCNISSNAAGHLKTHGILVGRAIMQPTKQLHNQSIEKGLQQMASKKETDDASRARVIMKNAVDKQRFRNAVTRFVTTCSLSHLSVTSEAFKDMILAANPEAKHALIKAATTLRPRIKRMFEE
jgi:hypothetical protein